VKEKESNDDENWNCIKFKQFVKHFHSWSEKRNNHLKEEIVSSIENLVDNCHFYKHRDRDNQPFQSHFSPKLSNISDKLLVDFSSLQLLKC
jgi:hypothetical protein